MSVESAGAAPGGKESRAKGVESKRWMMASGAAVMGGLLLWNAWLTRQTFDLQAAGSPFVKVQLQRIVGDYVQAQARSSKAPERVAAETELFMKTLDASVAQLGQEGKIVVVSEAVVGGNVPDVTDALREVVYSKVPQPKAATAGSVEDQMRAYLSQNGASNGTGR